MGFFSLRAVDGLDAHRREYALGMPTAWVEKY
jgi:hypothetical protein